MMNSAHRRGKRDSARSSSGNDHFVRSDGLQTSEAERGDDRFCLADEGQYGIGKSITEKISSTEDSPSHLQKGKFYKEGSLFDPGARTPGSADR